jgi:glyoxylase-like metal-dependent hydrolase (beta-lactamase superfamily II)
MTRKQSAATMMAITLALAVGVSPACSGGERNAQTILDDASQALGAGTLNSLAYSGSGFMYVFGQAVAPDAPWPKFNAPHYAVLVNYSTPALRQELIRTQFENPPRGGGNQPLVGEQSQVQVVSGDYAWNQGANAANPAPAAVAERTLQIWMTPHGFIKAATANNAQVTPEGASSLVSFEADGRPINGTLNAAGQVERVSSILPNDVLGDMPIEVTFSDYRDFSGLQFPTRIVQTQGGHPTFEITVSEVQPNAPVDIQVPENVMQAKPAPTTVQAQSIGNGVWHLTGSGAHSVAVEFADHMVVVEAPTNEERSVAVMAEVQKLVPSKPIRYVVNTHQHFDHAGGLRAYAAEGVTIITHQINKPYYERIFAAPSTARPDRLAASGRTVIVEGVEDRRTLADSSRTLELYHVQGNGHNDGLLIAYLPRERQVVVADAFTPPAEGTPPPQTPSPYTVNFHENLQRLKLSVAQIVPLHGTRLGTITDLERAIGRARTN